MQNHGIILFITVLILASMSSVEAASPWRSSPSNTSGWQLMTPEERIQHQARVRGFTDYESCEAYRRSHHEQMRLRAEERGLVLPQDGHDFCSHLKPHGSD